MACPHLLLCRCCSVRFCSTSNTMKRRSVRAPLAPLHSNSLHAGSPRCQEDLAKREAKKPLAKVDFKAPAKAEAPVKRASILEHYTRLSQRPLRPAKDTAARASSPVKARQSVPLVTTNAHSQAEATTSKGAPPSRRASLAAATHLRHNSLSSSAGHRGVAHPVTSSSTAPAAAVTAVSVTASPDVMSHWHTPGSQPHLDAILTPLDTPAASRRDTMYFPPPQATPAFTVQGAGTPQDFSDVFDLESVSTHTPGGCATLAGRRDSTPGLILNNLAVTSQQDQERSLHNWLASSPGNISRPNAANPPGSAVAEGSQNSSTSRPALATPAAAQVLKELRIKTPQPGSRGASSLLRSSPFLAQLLRTAPSLSPSPSLTLASPTSASRVVLRVPSPRASPESNAVPSPGRIAADTPESPSSQESAGSDALEETASGTLQVIAGAAPMHA